jgi:hypothetical protein
MTTIYNKMSSDDKGVGPEADEAANLKAAAEAEEAANLKAAAEAEEAANLKAAAEAEDAKNKKATDAISPKSSASLTYTVTGTTDKDGRIEWTAAIQDLNGGRATKRRNRKSKSKSKHNKRNKGSKKMY